MLGEAVSQLIRHKQHCADLEPDIAGLARPKTSLIANAGERIFRTQNMEVDMSVAACDDHGSLLNKVSSTFDIMMKFF